MSGLSPVELSVPSTTMGSVLLSRVVEVSGQVASTRSRLAKRDLIAALLAEVVGAGDDEIEIAASYLSGTLRQRRTGVGWRGLSSLPDPATEPSVTLTDVDSELESLSGLAGTGSATARRELATALFGRMTGD